MRAYVEKILWSSVYAEHYGLNKKIIKNSTTLFRDWVGAYYLSARQCHWISVWKGTVLRINIEQKSERMHLEKKNEHHQASKGGRNGTIREQKERRIKLRDTSALQSLIPLKLEGCYCDLWFRRNLQLDQPWSSFERVFFLASSVNAINSTKVTRAT